MSNASLDRLLALLVMTMVVTGLATLRAGTADLAWLFSLHGLAAAALLVGVALKLSRSVPRSVAHAARSPTALVRLAAALVVTATAVGSLSAGFVRAASDDPPTIRGWTLLTLHAWIGLALVPLVVAHLLPLRWRLLRPGPAVIERTRRRIGRRQLLAGAGLITASIGLYGAVKTIDRAGGHARRFTGSRWRDAGGIPPPTTFLGEPVPGLDRLDPATWRLRVIGRVARHLELTLDELRSLGREQLSAILDCTSGWALETAWGGVPMASVLDAAGIHPAARIVDVRAVTGWGASMGIEEARRCLLATEVGGSVLPAANGAPCRLVAPDRRGLDWVKWVTVIEVG
ncbi:MAG TPA: molybdopterin-dependent oxidoreductase [Candidatus Limnocylindrales bacterium]